MAGWADAAQAAFLRDFILLLFAAPLRDIALHLHIRNKKHICMWSSASATIIAFHKYGHPDNDTQNNEFRCVSVLSLCVV